MKTNLVFDNIVEGTGFDKYLRNNDFTYTKTGEKYNQLQNTNIPKGEGYFFKDFYIRTYNRAIILTGFN